MKVLLVDNYDSFTYNLLHYVQGFDVEVDVVFNNKIDFNSIKNYDKIILSPGPGLPKEAGDLMRLVKTFFEEIPIFGVCLGFQALVEHFGGEIYNQNIVKHGVKEKCFILNNNKLFKEVSEVINVGLYHSWAARIGNFPSDLKITARSENDVIMAFEHKSLPIFGVQFHPESIMTDEGRKIIENFLFNY